MYALAKELEFISQIKRDGSGVQEIPENYLRQMLENPLMNKENFKIHCLSVNEQTFLALGFNSFIVKLKNK